MGAQVSEAAQQDFCLGLIGQRSGRDGRVFHRLTGEGYYSPFRGE
jgi:hypothetical protein